MCGCGGGGGVVCVSVCVCVFVCGGGGGVHLSSSEPHTPTSFVLEKFNQSVSGLLRYYLRNGENQENKIVFFGSETLDRTDKVSVSYETDRRLQEHCRGCISAPPNCFGKILSRFKENTRVYLMNVMSGHVIL